MELRSLGVCGERWGVVSCGCGEGGTVIYREKSRVWGTRAMGGGRWESVIAVITEKAVKKGIVEAELACVGGS